MDEHLTSQIPIVARYLVQEAHHGRLCTGVGIRNRIPSLKKYSCSKIICALAEWCLEQEAIPLAVLISGADPLISCGFTPAAAGLYQTQIIEWARTIDPDTVNELPHLADPRRTKNAR